MIQKLAATAFILLLTFAANSGARSQWVYTNGPNLVEDGSPGRIDCLAAIDSSLFAGTDDPDWAGTFITTDYGATWEESVNGMTARLSYALIAGVGNLFAGADNGLYRSTNHGSSWMHSGTMNEVWSLVASGTNVFAGTVGQGVYLSTDSGSSWIPVNSGFDTTAEVDALAISGTNLVAGGENGNGIFISTNNGTSWTSANTGLTNLDVLSLTPVGTNLYAGTGGGIFLSTNNGTSWTNLYSGSIITSIVTSGSYLFAGGDGGVFLSMNNGTSWSIVDSGLTYPAVNALAISGPYLFAGSGVEGVWRRPLSDFNQSGVIETPAINEELSNYPNPFTQSTTITFTSPERGVASVAIVNILGTEVAQLYEGELSAGEHSFTWDAGKDACTTGVYECIVQMNGHVERTPIILSR